VDYQYIPSISQIDDPYIKYVALEKDNLGLLCDGNYVFWLGFATGKPVQIFLLLQNFGMARPFR
jgi:hypothetical protein